jgi:mannose-6-phosphate isomerase-like protein (cupin superfamily)
MTYRATQSALSKRDLAMIGGALKPVRLPARELAASRERLLRKIHAVPPAETITVRGQDIPWVRESPFRERKLLLRDFARNEQTYLVRLSPGAVSPPHSHDVQEIVWVIEGEVQIGDHVVRAGDLHVAAPGSYHADFRTVTGALVLIRSHIPADVPRPKAPGSD